MLPVHWKKNQKRMGVHKQDHTRAHTPPPACAGEVPLLGHAPQIRYSKRTSRWECLTGCAPSPGPRPRTSLMLGGGAQRKAAGLGCEEDAREQAVRRRRGSVRRYIGQSPSRIASGSLHGNHSSPPNRSRALGAAPNHSNRESYFCCILLRCLLLKSPMG